MNLFDMIQYGFEYLSKKDFMNILLDIRDEFFRLQEENFTLREQYSILLMENKRFREENTQMTQTIVSHIERDIIYMKNQVGKLNINKYDSSTIRIVEELD